MTRHYNELLNDVITLHAISNEAERIYTECPESEAVEALAKLCAPELGGVKQARAEIWHYVDAHPDAYRAACEAVKEVIA